MGLNLPPASRAVLLMFVCFMAHGHDPITTKLTWTREISRIVNARCANCHHQGGAAFSLMSYEEARPWAKAIEEEVLERRMPPWGAVKGFGDFRNDMALPQDQIELIANWVEGGAPEGDAKDLPAAPKFPARSPAPHTAGEIEVSGEFKLQRALILDGLWPKKVVAAAALRITAELPDGSVEPLLWLHNYNPQFGHPFLLRRPLPLPVGTAIHGVPAGTILVLLPATPGRAPGHRTARYSPRPAAGTAPRSGTSARGEKSY
jgi:hypothetical protein